MALNAATAYKDNRILTASPEELTLMLFDGAIKFCNIAIMAIEKNDIQTANTNIIKAEKIIVEFRSTLNFDYPVANDFDIIYEYIYRRLIEANVKKDKEIVEEALYFIREMRDTWKDAMKLAKGSK
jgi:flagellar protein FliS